MPKNFFITGMPKSGKTTIFRRLVDELKSRGLKVGGFISPEEKHHGTRSGFFVEDVETGKVKRLAAVDADGPKISKYHVDIKSFESIAVPSMKNVDMYDVFIVDEIGRMELKSSKFSDLLDKVFESHTPVIASLNRDYVERYRVVGEVIILTQTNREAIYLDLVNKTTAAYITKKPKKKPMVKIKPKAKKKAKPKKKEKPKRKVKAKKKAPVKKRAKKKVKPKKKEKKKEEKPREKRGVFGGLRDLIGI